jgi:hypothetical protein
MTIRNNLALLFLMFSISIAHGCCTPQEGGSGTCHELWADCPDMDYMIAESASDLAIEQVKDGGIFYSYYNCELGRRTPTLTISAECDLHFKY